MRKRFRGKKKTGDKKKGTKRGAEKKKKKTHPNPLDLPLVWSTIICASVTGPNCLKYSRNSADRQLFEFFLFEFFLVVEKKKKV